MPRFLKSLKEQAIGQLDMLKALSYYCKIIIYQIKYYGNIFNMISDKIYLKKQGNKIFEKGI